MDAFTRESYICRWRQWVVGLCKFSDIVRWILSRYQNINCCIISVTDRGQNHHPWEGISEGREDWAEGRTAASRGGWTFTCLCHCQQSRKREKGCRKGRWLLNASKHLLAYTVTGLTPNRDAIQLILYFQLPLGNIVQTFQHIFSSTIASLASINSLRFVDAVIKISYTGRWTCT